MSVEKGRKGEEIAKTFLEEKGYIIIAQNFRFKKAEIDLIATKGDEIIFVEVKMRNNHDFGYPEEYVTATKRAHLHRAIEGFLAKHKQYEDKWPRLDIIAITQKPFEIEHIENAEIA